MSTTPMDSLIQETLAELLKRAPDLGDKSEEIVTAVIEILAKKDALDDKFDAKTLRILHFNDVYNLVPMKPKKQGQVQPYGGFTRFAKAVAKFREDGAKPLVLFSGDFVGPSLASAITQGTHMLAALNYLDVSYGTWGNHEFDFGIQKLQDIVAGVVDEGEPDHGASTTKWIASNMNGSDGKPLAGAAKKVLVDWEGVKVGIIGASQNWLPGCAKIQDGEAQYLDFIEESRRLCEELRAEGAEVLLALTHSRLDSDKKFAKEIPEVDLVLGGHDHFPFLNLNDRIIKGAQEFEYLNSIEITVKTNGQRPHVKATQVPIFLDMEEDEGAKKIVATFENLIHEKMGATIGRTPVALESTEDFLRFRESELGNFIADVMCDDLDAEIGLIQGFQIQGKYVLEPGIIKIADVYSWFPSGVSVISVKLTGAQIKEVLESGVRSLPGECGGFVHVSRRLRYVLDADRQPGDRVTAVTINGTPIVDTRSYVTAITATLGSATGYGTDFVVIAPRVVDEEHERPITDVVIDYLKLRGAGNPIDTTEPHKHGRVIELARGEQV